MEMCGAGVMAMEMDVTAGKGEATRQRHIEAVADRRIVVRCG